MTSLAIIPKPVSFELTGGSQSLPDKPVFSFDLSQTKQPIEKFISKHFLNWLPDGAIRFSNSTETNLPTDFLIQLITKASKYPDEGYHLTIANKKITIESSSYNGFVFALQTLGQLFESGQDIPYLECHDSPRFSWRGMHLDVSRHFFPVDFILKFLRLMARYKFNNFHWHLTDDQGWRIAIESFPKLTEIGAYRSEADKNTYGGFYSRDDIKNVIAYAHTLGITVLPEIDLPGHASAMIAAYPELSCNQSPIEIPNSWGIFNNCLCPSREFTYQFIETVLIEITAMFDSPLIHIGGDECLTDAWQEHNECQSLIKKLKLSSSSQLQGHFNNRLANIIKSFGKQMVGWDEILESTPPSEAIVMCWRDSKYAEQAVMAGHKVIMSPTSHCYFDYYQALSNEPKAIGGHLPLEKVYQFDPLASDLLKENAELVLGGQGNIWTEYMPTSEHVEYMATPRICALSESLWSEKNTRTFDSFTQTLASHLATLGQVGYNYRSL